MDDIKDITAKKLKDGIVFVFETKDKNDLREAEISFSDLTNKYIIWFNGKLIHGTQTFPPVLKRLEKLNLKFPLEFSYAENN